MPTGEEYLVDGDYTQAIKKLEREAARERQDTFRLGAILSLGEAYLLAGQHAKAREHAESLIHGSKHGTFSKHFILAGTVHWFYGDRGVAVGLWREAGAAQHLNYRGLDGPFLLYYASVRDPSLIDRNDVEKKIIKEMYHTSPISEEHAIAQYLLGRWNESQFRRAMNPVNEGFADHLLAGMTAAAEYYIGLGALRDGKPSVFVAQMKKCAAMRGYEFMQEEFVIARLEARRLP